MNNSLKNFFIKLISIVVAIVLILSSIYNIFLADKLDKVSNILSVFDDKDLLKVKIKKELNEALLKDEIFKKEDKELLKKIYIKLKKEFNDIQ